MTVPGLKGGWMVWVVCLGCGAAPGGAKASVSTSDAAVGVGSGANVEVGEIATGALRDALRTSGAESGFVIVADALTGRQLAAVGLRAPTPAEAERAEPIPALIEPASLSKPLLAAAALEQGATTLDELHGCGPGAAGFDRFERLTVGQMVIRSSTRCATRIAERLPPGAWWSAGCVDPRRLVEAYRAFANDGAGAPDGRRVASAATAAQVRQMLAQVVSEGTGTRARSAVYSTAGKTGSSAGDAPCAAGTKVASFLGIAPVERPAIVVLAAISNPGVGPALGGRQAAPLFREVVERVLRVLGVPPDRPTRQ